jgi:hypothetical protein
MYKIKSIINIGLECADVIGKPLLMRGVKIGKVINYNPDSGEVMYEINDDQNELMTKINDGSKCSVSISSNKKVDA